MAGQKPSKRLLQKTSSKTNVHRLNKASKKFSGAILSLDKQRINTLSLPSAEGFAKAASFKRLLQTKKRIAIVSGAGISVNAGVPDFRTIRKCSRISFDISACDSSQATERFHAVIRDISRLSAQAKPTPFHHFMDQLAQDGRLLRHYTQNIDCIEHRLCYLREQTIQLHGRIDQARCQSCCWSGPLVAESFVGSQLPDCPRCQQVALEREQMGKRRLGIGRIRPNVVLYGDDNPNAGLIGEISECDLRTGPDVVFVVGTGLKVPGARRLAKELCHAAKSQGGLTVWMNKDLPPCNLGIAFDLVFQGDCDDLATAYLG